ncbi:MAG: deoxyuridine 5'-triphosphate nucleotidohydrolase, partial [Halobacteriales archaeon]|nr:deoxyuridine 5'-triphosphate nucleotidohydrolase [Halobacteriales archaeon]
MFRSGAFVAEYISPVSGEQVQPNGVDLTLDRVFKQVGVGRIARDGKEIGDREPVEPSREGVVALDPGGYIL